MFTLFRDLFAIWLRHDQIRISPAEGRLLGLHPDDRFVFRGQCFRVNTRQIDRGEQGIAITYDLITPDGRSLLTVNDSSRSAELRDETGSHVVFDDDIVMLSR